MIQYEANLDGTVEIAEAYANFIEGENFLMFLHELGWRADHPFIGRGGYYRFEVKTDSKNVVLHVYLKKLTFGGRENRQFEKRAQFSAALDRTGFDIEESDHEHTLILAIYRREKYSDSVVCAWNVADWGYNVGRAFNCFVDIHSVASALKVGFSQHETSTGQIVCCFRSRLLGFYIENKTLLHSQLFTDTALLAIANGTFDPDQQATGKKSGSTIPKFDDLFNNVLDVLTSCGGTASATEIEFKVGELLELPTQLREQIHNPKEGYRTELGYQLAWTRTYLKRAGLVRSSQKSIWHLTESGKSASEVGVDKYQIKKLATADEVNKEVTNDWLSDVQTEDLNREIEREGEPTSLEIKTPFDPNKVDIKTKTMSLDLILKRLSRDQIDLDTSFQRKAGLWDRGRQSRLIESILIKFPLPAFYFDGSNDENWLVVDGLQRLSSLNDYVNENSFGLRDLEFLGQLKGKTYRELPANLQRRIEESEITAYIIAPGTPKTLKFNVFKRINTGGLILTSQEIRNAIYQGKPANFVKSLADLPSFKKATSFAIQEGRMLDREFSTRFLAFYLTPPQDYDSDLDSFLNSALESVYTMPDDQVAEISTNFDNAMKTAFSMFGDDAFRKRYHKDDNRKPINKGSFEVWSVLLGRLKSSQSSVLISRSEEVRKQFIDLLNTDTEFNAAISASTGDKSRVRKRFSEVEKIIQSALK